MAGLKYNTNNTHNYLYSNSLYWLFSPSVQNKNRLTYVWYVYGYSFIDYTVVKSGGVRGSISLFSSTRVTGTGSISDPFVVI